MEVGIYILIVVNIAAVAFSYGRLSQKVNDACRRIGRLETLLNNRLNNPGDKSAEGKQ